MEKYFLDKTISVDKSYRTETDKAYVVFKVGTNSTSKATLTVAGSPVLETIDITGNLRPINTNLTGPLPLGAQFVVIPPAKPFSFSGSSGSYMRLVGEIIELAPGEVLPTDLLSRFTEQPRVFRSYLTGTYSSAAAASIAENAEFDVIPTASVPVGEKWTFDSLYMGEVWTTADTIARELLTSRIYVNGKPLDIIEKDMGPLGIYGSAAPHPPRETVNEKAFTFEDKPLILEPGNDYRVTCINTGAAATLGAGETLEARVKWVFVKELLS